MYLCYGIHHMLNIVTNKQDVPDAVLIRAIKPIIGVKEQIKRRNVKKLTPSIFNGPGKVSQALGLTIKQDGEPLKKGRIWIEDLQIEFDKHNIETGPRIGIDYAEEDALLPYRFSLDMKYLEHL